jgi:hypothetical protein
MKKIFSLFYLTLFFIQQGKGQNMSETWARTGGGSGNDEGIDLVADQNGHLYITGNYSGATFSLGGLNLTNSATTAAFIAKLDTAGNSIWLKNLAAGVNVFASALTRSSDGSIYVAGSFGLSKFDDNGNQVWNKSITGATKMECDSYGSLYVFYGNGFTKYSPSGTLLYQRNAPLGTGADMSIDKLNNVHLLYNNAGFAPSSSVLWFDSLGTQAGTKPLTALTRFVSDGIKVRLPNSYYLIGRFLSTQPDELGRLQYGYNLIGGATGLLTNCLNRTPVSPEADGFGYGYFAGTLQMGLCGPLGPQPFTVPLFFGTPNIVYLTGYDIYYIRTALTQHFNGSTALCGYTNETPKRIALDTVGQAMYIIGKWSKLADTSKFRFGNTVLTNFGNGPSSDLLLLKLSIPSQPLTVTTGTDRTICFGGSTTLSASATGGAGNFTYQWVPSSGLSNPSISNPIANPSTTISYVVTVTDASGASVRDTITVNINQNLFKPTISAITPDPFCEGQQVELRASSALSYQWSAGVTGNGSAFASISVSASDTITVTATNSEGCIGTSDPFITIMKPRTPSPTITPAGNAQNIINACTGTPVTLTAQNTQSPVSYFWSTGATSSSISTQTAGSYSVSATGPNGCASLSASRTIVYNALPTGSISAAGNTTICNGDSVQLTVNTPAANSVVWNNGATTNSIWVKTSGTYSATITSPAGCSNATQNSINVTVNALPLAPTINANGSTTFCAGGNVILTAQSSQTGISFLWSTGATTSSISVNSSGVYSVKAVNANGCVSSSSNNVTTTVNPLPTGTIVANGSTTICSGDSVLLTMNTVAGNSILWSTGSTSNSIWVKTAGTYTAQLTSSQGCTNTASNSITVQVAQRPTPSISQSGNTLTVNPAAAAYQWYLNSVAINGATSQTLNITTGGAYSVTVANAGGCTATAVYGAVLRIANPSLTYQVYPNPATDKIGIVYTLKQGEKVSVRIKNQQGQNIITVIDNQQQSAGDYRLTVDAIGLQKGIVYVEFTIGNKIVSHKLVIM